MVWSRGQRTWSGCPLWGRILYLWDWSSRLVSLQHSHAVLAFIMHKVLVMLLILRELPFGQQVKYAVLECSLEREVCVIMWKEHGLCSLDLPLASATGLSCGGEGAVMVLQEKDLPGYSWIDNQLCSWTERININYTLHVHLSAAVMKDVITLFSSWNINWGYWAFCYKVCTNAVS